MSFSRNHNFHINEEYDTNAKYKAKYYRLKKLINCLVYENAALCDLVTEIQDKIVTTKEERKYLLLKLYQLDPSLVNNSTSQEVSTNNKKSKKRSNNDSESKPSKQRKSSQKVHKKIVQPIPLDSAGRPRFPIILGSLTIHSLGDVVSDRSKFHTEDVIYPVGFVSTRLYGSTKDPETKCIYTCKIFDDGNSPKFEIAADNDLESPIIGYSADQCHFKLLQLINNAAQSQVVSGRPKGHEFFGISHPTVLNLIQSSPGTRKCTQYKWSKFEVSRSIEPIVEENDATLNYESLLHSLTFSKYHTVPEVKEEPPDEILDNSSTTLRDLLMS